jgi:hypothetical protein
MYFILALMGILGAIASLVFAVWCLVIAFRTNVWWGLAYMFVPFAALAFAITHWDEAGKPFLGLVCSIALATCISLTLPGARGGMSLIGGRNWEGTARATTKNMKMVQVAAEAYAVDHGGTYPPNIELFKCDFPEGRPPALDGKAPINPVTREAEWPVAGNVTDVAAARTATPGTIKAGSVEYSVIYDSAHRSVGYAVRGGASDGQALANPKEDTHTLVLSNQ